MGQSFIDGMGTGLPAGETMRNAILGLAERCAIGATTLPVAWSEAWDLGIVGCADAPLDMTLAEFVGLLVCLEVR